MLVVLISHKSLFSDTNVTILALLPKLISDNKNRHLKTHTPTNRCKSTDRFDQ